MTMTIVKEKSGYAIIKLDDHPPSHAYHVVRMGNGQVYSALPSDMPRHGGSWYASISPAGIDYVANGRSLAAAIAGLRRLIRASFDMADL